MFLDNDIYIFFFDSVVTIITPPTRVWNVLKLPTRIFSVILLSSSDESVEKKNGYNVSNAVRAEVGNTKLSRSFITKT